MRAPRPCGHCGSPVAQNEGRSGPKLYCDARCSASAKNDRNRGPLVRDCAWCGEEFSFGPGRGQKRKYCSSSCRRDSVKDQRDRATYAPCAIEGCEEMSRTRGYEMCEMHYGRVRRHGSPTPSGCPRCGRAPRSERNGAFCSRDCSLAVAKYSKYGLSIEQGLEVEREAANKCAICGSSPTNGKQLFWDHCHDSGKLRGLLCSNCNTGIGMLKDDPEVLIAAARYLS